MSSGRVAVIGAGQMGYGLCVQFALMGKDVVLIDHRESNLETARTQIEQAIEFLNREGLANAALETVIENIEFTADLAGGVGDTDVVLETISEDLPTKHTVFEEVSLVTRAIIAMWRAAYESGDSERLNSMSNPP